MYTEPHQDLLEALKKRQDFRLMDRRLNLGEAIRKIRKDHKLPLAEVIKKTGLKERMVVSLTQQGDMNTSQDNFFKISQGLNAPPSEFVRVAEELSRYNCYFLKRDEAPHFKYRTHETYVFSPPCFTTKDFFWCLVRIKPGASIVNLKDEMIDEVAGYLTYGALTLKYGHQQLSLTANDLFTVEPEIGHGYVNLSQSQFAELFLMYRMKPAFLKSPETRGRKRKETPGTISMASLIEQIRRELSPDPSRLLTIPDLAALSGISRKSLSHMIYDPVKTVPFEDMNRLASLTNHTLDELITKAENRYSGCAYVFGDKDNVEIDLSARYGVKLISHMGLGIKRRQGTIADVTLLPWKQAEGRKVWTYQGSGFIGIYGKRGLVDIQYGKRPLITLEYGDTIYLNASVEISIMNKLSLEEAKSHGESEEAKAVIFSSPPFI